MPDLHAARPGAFAAVSENPDRERCGCAPRIRFARGKQLDGEAAIHCVASQVFGAKLGAADLEKHDVPGDDAPTVWGHRPKPRPGRIRGSKARRWGNETPPRVRKRLESHAWGVAPALSHRCGPAALGVVRSHVVCMPSQDVPFGPRRRFGPGTRDRSASSRMRSEGAPGPASEVWAGDALQEYRRRGFFRLQLLYGRPVGVLRDFPNPVVSRSSLVRVLARARAAAIGRRSRHRHDRVRCRGCASARRTAE